MEKNLNRDKDFLELDSLAMPIVQTLNLPLIVLDEDFKMLAANKAFCELIHVEMTSLIGRKITAISGGVFNTRHMKSALEKVNSESSDVRDLKIELSLDNNITLHLLITIQHMQQHIKSKGLLLLSIENISGFRNKEEKLKNRVKEQHFEIQEIHHRIKNNLFMISTILKLQAEKSGSEEISRALRDSSLRVNAISLIHQTLFESEIDNKILLNKMIEKLLSSIRWIYPKFAHIKYTADIPDIDLHTKQATTVGIVLTEIISNVCRHAFDDLNNAELSISCRTNFDRITLSIKDNGKGIDPDIEPAHTESFGFRLINEMVVNQLKGNINIRNNRGTEIEFSFSKAANNSVLQDISN